MSLDKYNELFTRAYNMEATNKVGSEHLYKQAEEEMKKYLSAPKYYTSSNNTSGLTSGPSYSVYNVADGHCRTLQATFYREMSAYFHAGHKE